jgi:hypothetical protein
MYPKQIVTKCVYFDVFECGIVQKKVSVIVAPYIPTKLVHSNGQKLKSSS